MKRALTIAGTLLATLLFALAALFFWASSGRLSADERVQTSSYSADPNSTAPDTLTVTTYNIGYLSGMTNNEPVVRSDSLLSANLEQAITLLQNTDSDVIGFQEIDFGSARSGYVQQLDTIATRLGYAAGTKAVNWDERYLPFPYGWPAVHFGRTVSGQALLSQFPIQDHGREVLPRPDQFFVRDAFYLDRLAQVGLIDFGGYRLAVMNLHLETFDMDTREEQAREVNALYHRLVQVGLPVVVIGDMNSVLPAARAHLPMEERQTSAEDETMTLLLKGTDLRPLYSDSSYAADPHPATFPADAPTRKIDHIFYPSDLLTPVDREIRCGGPSPPSDHCTVTGSFTLSEAAREDTADATIPSLDRVLAE